MLKDISLLYYTNLFSRNEYQKNDNTKAFSIPKEFKMGKSIALFVVSIENLKTLKYHTFAKKHSFFLLFAVSLRMKMKNIKFEKEESIEILKIHNYFKSMVEENISQEYRLKNVDETKNYFVEEIEQNELMSKKHKKVCATLNYIEHTLILASIVTVSISALASLFGILI